MRISATPTALTIAAIFAVCAPPAIADGTAADKADATAQLQGPDGASLGEATFTETPNGVLVVAELEGLPEGEHGFHIHTTGDCSPSFQAAGGHLAEAGGDHGLLAEAGPHAGDMPNIHVPASGELAVETLNPRLSLNGGETPLLDEDGAALVIHAGADDYESQPSGDAGDRIACGVIEPAAS